VRLPRRRRARRRARELRARARGSAGGARARAAESARRARDCRPARRRSPKRRARSPTLPRSQPVRAGGARRGDPARQRQPHARAGRTASQGLDGELERLSVPATTRSASSRTSSPTSRGSSRAGKAPLPSCRLACRRCRSGIARVGRMAGASRRLADLEAREQALAALQARVGTPGQDAWLGVAVSPMRRSCGARWTSSRAGTTHSNPCCASAWKRANSTLWIGRLPGRRDLRAAGAACPVRAGARPPRAFRRGDALLARVRIKRSELAASWPTRCTACVAARRSPKRSRSATRSGLGESS